MELNWKETNTSLTTACHHPPRPCFGTSKMASSSKFFKVLLMGTLILHLWSPLPVFTGTAQNLFWSLNSSLNSSLPFCSLHLLQFQAGLQVSFPTTGGPSPHFPSSLDLLGNIRIIPPNQAVSGISFLCAVLVLHDSRMYAIYATLTQQGYSYLESPPNYILRNEYFKTF